MSNNMDKVSSLVARHRAVAYAVLAALMLILLVHAPIVPVLVGCSLAAAASIVRARFRRADKGMLPGVR